MPIYLELGTKYDLADRLNSYLGDIGITPLPPYIKRTIEDPERYQTIFAEHSGSAAAPTAGLHFSPRLFARLAGKGIRCASITLHIGLDTFGPVVVEDPDDHQIHTEWCRVPPETAELVNRTREAGNRVVAIGTTCVRALETAAAGLVNKHSMTAYEGQTSLFMKPGYSFQIVDTMLTNFHLPRSTLLMMICGFAGREFVLETYKVAVNYRYRFYSFGDAMLIL